MGKRGFCLEVWGEFACFTRPEMKVERVSYDVITPSAARAIYSAILWKPAIRWRIDRIDVLAPIRWITVRRNEVGAEATGKLEPISAEEHRDQRTTLMLRDVRYRLYAHFDFIPPENRCKHPNVAPEWLQDDKEKRAGVHEPGPDETPAKYAGMFERRARKGQCFIRPYLGCREFAAYFRLVDDPASEPLQPIHETRDLGFMLFDMDFSDPKDIRPLFYRAKMEQGVIHVPHQESEEVLK